MVSVIGLRMDPATYFGGLPTLLTRTTDKIYSYLFLTYLEYN